MAMGRLEAHSHETMDRSKASDRSGKGLYGLLYQPNPCLGPCVVRLRVGEGRRWVGVCPARFRSVLARGRGGGALVKPSKPSSRARIFLRLKGRVDAALEPIPFRAGERVPQGLALRTSSRSKQEALACLPPCLAARAACLLNATSLHFL